MFFVQTQIKYSGMLLGLTPGTCNWWSVRHRSKFSRRVRRPKGEWQKKLLEEPVNSHSSDRSHQQLCAFQIFEGWSVTPVLGVLSVFYSKKPSMCKDIFAYLTHIKWIWILGLCQLGSFHHLCSSLRYSCKYYLLKSCNLEITDFYIFSASLSKSAR